MKADIDKITKSKTGWIVETSIGTIIEAKCVVVAAGAGSFVPRKLPIENIDQFCHIGELLSVSTQFSMFLGTSNVFNFHESFGNFD